MKRAEVNYLGLVFLCLFLFRTCGSDSNTCDRGFAVERKYLTYDVNPGEGFNLRRDVYMRISILVKKLQSYGDFVLVLPPWGPLPHWKSRDLPNQSKIPWAKFFNLKSLNKYIPVIELSDLFSGTKQIVIDQLVVLQHFENAWTSGKWEEKFEFTDCDKKFSLQKENGRFRGRFWGYENIPARNVSCISFQGHTKTLQPLITSLPGRLIMIDRAEIALHDEFGNSEYWKVRRSMRFSSRLYFLAKEFLREHLMSKNELDSMVLPDDWRDENARKMVPKGGKFICGHLRRQDFVYGRSIDVPSLKTAAKQLKLKAISFNITNIFVASDGTSQELEELREHLEPGFRLVFYQPSLDIRKEVLDGGVAIIDQIVCSRAQYFIGSFESTFSFRIQEEREILRFPPDSTFNRFCGDSQDFCEQPARWRIAF